MFKFYNDGVVSFEDLEKSKGLKKPQLQQIRHELYDQDPETDSRAIEEFLSSLSYPLYFLDFETFQPAIPLFDITLLSFHEALFCRDFEDFHGKAESYKNFPWKNSGRRGRRFKSCRFERVRK